jgi:hypothetical protein
MTNCFTGIKGEKAKKLKMIRNTDAHKLKHPTKNKMIYAFLGASLKATGL